MTKEHLIYAASDNRDGLAITSQPLPQFSYGTMLMMLQANMELPVSTELEEINVAGHTGWLKENSKTNEIDSTKQWYQYSFAIPVNWLEGRGPSSDRLFFLSEPALYNLPHFCPLLSSVMTVDFAVAAPGNFGTGAPGSGPDVTGFTATTIADHPAWIQTVSGGEMMGPEAMGTAVYIQGPEFWYYFWISCTPPIDFSAEDHNQFEAECNERITDILHSFQISE